MKLLELTPGKVCRKSDNVFPTIPNPLGDYVCIKCICIFDDKKQKQLVK